jgi:D-glycero-alpha-D-manno-heptose 1-phosphate guanylyltransferase
MPEAIILAGGFGTRLQKILGEIPKSMAPVAGRPFLEYLLDYLILNGANKFVLSVGYRSEVIIEHFGSAYRGVEIDYAVEEEPLGTGGGIKLALGKCHDDHVLALNGDTLFLADLKDFYSKHLSYHPKISIALREVEDISRYGSVRINDDFILTAFGEKSAQRFEGLINAGIYCISREWFMANSLSGAFSLETDCLAKWYKQGILAGFLYNAYFLDIGIPEDYQRAQHEFEKLTYS